MLPEGVGREHAEGDDRRDVFAGGLHEHAAVSPESQQSLSVSVSKAAVAGMLLSADLATLASHCVSRLRTE